MEENNRRNQHNIVNQPHFNLKVHSLKKKMVKMYLFQNRNRVTDVENKHGLFSKGEKATEDKLGDWN